MNKFVIFATLGALAGCTSAQVNSAVTQAEQVVAIGQLVCQQGPTFLAMVDPSGAAIIAKGASSSFVSKVCAEINATATALPAGAAVVQAVVTPPAG